MSSVAEANAVLISYLRFKRQFHYICTEGEVPGRCRADVLASDGKTLMEFEIKTNVADIYRDATKERKHELYKLGGAGVPNTLTYVIHEDCAEKALQIVPKEYGVISFDDHNFRKVRVLRKAKKLHDKEVSSATLTKIVKRMGSEIANWHLNLIVRLELDRVSLYNQILEACLSVEKSEIDTIFEEQD